MWVAIIGNIHHLFCSGNLACPFSRQYALVPAVLEVWLWRGNVWIVEVSGKKVWFPLRSSLLSGHLFPSPDHGKLAHGRVSETTDATSWRGLMCWMLEVWSGRSLACEMNKSASNAARGEMPQDLSYPVWCTNLAPLVLHSFSRIVNTETSVRFVPWQCACRLWGDELLSGCGIILKNWKIVSWAGFFRWDLVWVRSQVFWDRNCMTMVLWQDLKMTRGLVLIALLFSLISQMDALTLEEKIRDDPDLSQVQNIIHLPCFKFQLPVQLKSEVGCQR